MKIFRSFVLGRITRLRL